MLKKISLIIGISLGLISLFIYGIKIIKIGYNIEIRLAKIEMDIKYIDKNLQFWIKEVSSNNWSGENSKNLTDIKNLLDELLKNYIR